MLKYFLDTSSKAKSLFLFLFKTFADKIFAIVGYFDLIYYLIGEEKLLLLDDFFPVRFVDGEGWITANKLIRYDT